jgi:hypothetical protein
VNRFIQTEAIPLGNWIRWVQVAREREPHRRKMPTAPTMPSLSTQVPAGLRLLRVVGIGGADGVVGIGGADGVVGIVRGRVRAPARPGPMTNQSFAPLLPLWTN